MYVILLRLIKHTLLHLLPASMFEWSAAVADVVPSLLPASLLMMQANQSQLHVSQRQGHQLVARLCVAYILTLHLVAAMQYQVAPSHACRILSPT